LQERDAKDIEIPNIRWDVFEFMMRCEFGFYFLPYMLYSTCSLIGSIFSCAFRFIYTGSIEVNLEIAQDLLKAADQYLLDGLKRLCEYAIAQVGHGTCLAISFYFLYYQLV
jgi:hypothetical protein